MPEPTGNGAGQGDGNNNGGQGGGDGKQNQNGGQGAGSQNQGGQDSFDVDKALENKDLWAHPRLKELTAAQAELKKLKDQQAKADDDKLKEQNQFKELSEKKDGELAAANETIKNMRIDQALTTKLVGEKVVDLDGALKLVDRSKLSIDDAGNVSGVDDALAALKTDKAYLFNNSGSGGVGAPSNPGNGGQPSGPMRFKQSQLSDPTFYKENRDEIIKAAKAGLIEMDVTPTRQAA